MIRYIITKGLDYQWGGKAYLKEPPFGEGIAIIKKKGNAQQFYSDEEKVVEKLLRKRGVKFEKEGESENRPLKKIGK